MFAGSHADEVAPCPVVAGDDDAGFGGVGEHGAGCLPGGFATFDRVAELSE
jgi:hypothetical protein